MVVEVSYVKMTPDLLLCHVVYLGEQEDKLAIHIRRDFTYVTARPGCDARVASAGTRL
jgi:hypothetical protein